MRDCQNILLGVGIAGLVSIHIGLLPKQDILTHLLIEKEVYAAN